MAERPGLVEAWTRALHAHARYAEALGSLTSTWLRELADLGAAVRLPRVVAVPGFDRPAPDHAPGAASAGPGTAHRVRRHRARRHSERLHRRLGWHRARSPLRWCSRRRAATRRPERSWSRTR